MPLREVETSRRNCDDNQINDEEVQEQKEAFQVCITAKSSKA